MFNNPFSAKMDVKIRENTKFALFCRIHELVKKFMSFMTFLKNSSADSFYEILYYRICNARGAA